VDLRSELVTLLEERTLSHRERRKRRLQQIPGPVTMAALEKMWNHRDRQEPLPLTRDEYIVISFGWLPEEQEQMIQFAESKGCPRAEQHLQRVQIIPG